MIPSVLFGNFVATCAAFLSNDPIVPMGSEIFRSSASQVEGTLHWEENENARVENLLANGGCESRLPVLLVAAPDGAPQQTIHLYRCFQQTDPVDLTLHLLNAPLIAVGKLIAVGTFRLRNNP
jgi:hypothetical protein